ncbi:nucleoside triphosphate pyrophosphohydrolase [Pseudomaricurvus sp.]|uniref:nucleoside triphosphate pyrophosphohydrolase n=1 Tax=Pseudomaricurvus sp. TaxID=2004510 RepID=UPI003F6B455C
MTEPRGYSLDDLKELMRRLREPDTGCPWDIVQTYQSIAPSTIEEAYEVVDAIERENYPHLKEELGDLLFQVIFYSQIATEEHRFNFNDVVSDLVSKLIRRHPHVFPDNTLESRISAERTQDEEKQIKFRWEALKKEEREAKGQMGLLDDIPVTLPAMTRAAKLQKRASSAGFDWSSMEGVLAQIEEELEEVKEAVRRNQPDEVKEELGDLIFSVVNACRHAKVDPESATRATNDKFEQRFRYIERKLAEQGETPEVASLERMDQLWDEAKQALQKS